MKPPNYSNSQRTSILVLLYSLVMVAATVMAYAIRFDFSIEESFALQYARIGPVWVGIWMAKLAALTWAGQFASLLSFFSLPDLRRLALALGPISLVLLVAWHFPGVLDHVSRSVIVLDGILGLAGMVLCRLGFRLVRESAFGQSGEVTRVGIVGAGQVGAALARELQTQGSMVPVIFFDDASGKAGSQVHGIPVAGSLETLREPGAPELDEVIIAIPSAPGARVREMVELLESLELPFRTVPSMSQLARGDIATALRPVEIGDILGRESVEFRGTDCADFFAGKTVLVTGAGGSIGSELSRQLAKLNPKAMVLLDHSESALFEIQQELAATENLSVALADVKDEAAVKTVLDAHGPQVIFHAAAFKHVAMMEQHPEMAVANNVMATHQLAELAAANGVEHFVLISTDKAVAPTCVMGATKRLAERIMEGHALAGGGTRFITVRFGNVLGSSGSVVPIFQKQIEEGGPVTVRDRNLSRFFMSIPEAAGLVLHSAALGKNGDRFILDMGEPVRIADLAEQMIRLSGKTPGREIEIQFTELLPGEKLHEELHNPGEALTETEHPKIKRIQGDALETAGWEKLRAAMKQDAAAESSRKWLQLLLTNYRP